MFTVGMYTRVTRKGIEKIGLGPMFPPKKRTRRPLAALRAVGVSGF